jgi:hypothetical protein
VIPPREIRYFYSSDPKFEEESDCFTLPQLVNAILFQMRSPWESTEFLEWPSEGNRFKLTKTTFWIKPKDDVKDDKKKEKAKTKGDGADAGVGVGPQAEEEAKTEGVGRQYRSGGPMICICRHAV